MQSPRLSPPGEWSLLGVQLHCYPLQLEETPWEQVPPLEMLLLPQTLPPDLVIEPHLMVFVVLLGAISMTTTHLLPWELPSLITS